MLEYRMVNSKILQRVDEEDLPRLNEEDLPRLDENMNHVIPKGNNKLGT